MAFPIGLGLLGGGALAGGLSSLFGKSPKQQQVSRLSPQQLGLQQQAGDIAAQGLQNPYAGFEPIEQQARSQFQSSTIPSLAERFSSMGSGGQRSSAFQGALGQAGAGLESNLAALKSQYGLQNRGLISNLLGMSLQPSFDTIFQTPQARGLGGFLQGGLSSLASPLSYLGTQGLINQGLFGGGNQGGANTQDIQSTLEQILKLLQGAR